MKRDEVLEGLGLFVFWLRGHLRTLLLVLAGIAVAAIVGAGAFSYLQSRESRAQDRLAEAISAFEEAGAGPASRAEELFREVREDFGRTDAAAIAGVYLGELAARSGNLEGAREYWEEFTRSQSEHLLAAQVRVNLMELDRAQGKGEELATRLRALLASEAPELPTDLLLYQLAVTLERLDREDEAIEAYRRLADEYPQSVYAAEARGKGGTAVPPQLATFGS